MLGNIFNGRLFNDRRGTTAGERWHTNRDYGEYKTAPVPDEGEDEDNG